MGNVRRSLFFNQAQICAATKIAECDQIKANQVADFQALVLFNEYVGGTGVGQLVTVIAPNDRFVSGAIIPKNQSLHLKTSITL
ncbi:hypothetical protein [Pacificibacter maritimus]|uniref:hypothetical protein n=1 Tax=Pacificibacter maritimus TaxID=762213 RepID=UPI000F50FFF8|nr:hypothetical protein [Pacificibacter maritimus]